MVNVNKLKGKMVEKGLTVELLAKELGINTATLYRKLRNDGNGDKITIKEANAMVTVLALEPDEAISIFFNNTVA